MIDFKPKIMSTLKSSLQIILLDTYDRELILQNSNRAVENLRKLV